MNKLFDIVFLDETFEFLSNLEKKHYEKIIFNIRKAQTSAIKTPDSEIQKAKQVRSRYFEDKEITKKKKK